MSAVSLLVLAKQPVPGRVKTRLTPPCTPAQAARLADAALRDTLDVVKRTPAGRKVLVFDGDARSWQKDGVTVVAQEGRGLAERLQGAFDSVRGPALLVGMDTPQLTPELLLSCVRALDRSDVDAVLGPTPDGGFWSIGFSRAVAGAFRGVPMSSPTTWGVQRRRLRQLGLRVDEQPMLRDVDTIADAHAVVGDAPHTRFAAELRAMA
jgi:hypothetical protein